MNQNPNQQSNPVQSIILDTCILIHLVNKDIYPNLSAYILELKNAGYGFAVSDVTTYEAIKGSKPGEEGDIIDFLNELSALPVSMECLIIAARLNYFYNNHNETKTLNREKISTEDKIIAATSILTTSLALTANINDFPRPFFNERHSREIYYTKKGKRQIINVALLEPNYPTISHIAKSYQKKEA